LGIRSTDAVPASELKESGHGSFRHVSDHAVPLTARDRRAAVRTLETIGGRGIHDVGLAEQAAELQTMMMLNLKAEIQFVDNYDDLARWLDGKLCR